MSKRKLYLALIVIFLLALTVRLTFIFIFPDLYAPDTSTYTAPANNLARGYGYTHPQGEPYIAREPGYPAFLAFIYVLFDQSDWAVKVVQAVVDACTCLLAFALGRIVYGVWTGLVAALGLALYPTIVASVGFVLSETWFTFLITAALLFLVRYLRVGQWWVLGLGGLFLGAAIMTRAGLLFYPFFLAVAIWVLARKKRRMLGQMILLMLVCYSVPLLWTVRNYQAFGVVIPVRARSAEPLWQGTMVEWGGDWQGTPEQRAAEEAIIAGATDLLEADRRLTQAALENIRQDPLAYISLLPVKAWRLWVGVPGSHRLLQKYPLLERWQLLLLWCVVLVFSLVGLWVTRSRWRLTLPLLLLLVYFTLLHAVTFATPRYHIPLIPVIIIFSAAGLLWLVELFRGGLNGQKVG